MIHLTTQNTKGNALKSKDDFGLLRIAIDNPKIEGHITVNAFSGQGENYKRMENELVGIYSEMESVFCGTFEELVALLNPPITEDEIKQFKKDWGQEHSEICSCLGYDEEGSEDLLMDDYFWYEESQLWLNKHASGFSERDKKIADHLKN